ncbi:MAG: septum formation initiator family protein [Erysipelotrichaceae bacterium]|nr:septum formation initiator family protein [Erysipelotrichaceae bacterium]
MSEKKVNKKKKKPLNSVVVGILCIAMIWGIIYFVWQISKEVGTTFTLLADINDAKKELAELQEEQEHLLLQKERLMDDEYVKSWARGEFLLVQEGEEIYRLPGN